MLSRLQVTVLLVVVVVIWTVLLALNGVPLSTALVSPFSGAVSGLGVVLIAFDKAIWKWRHLHPWLVPHRSIGGTWRGVLESEWIDPQTLQRWKPTEVYLVVRQTYSTVSARLLTAESESGSVVATIRIEPDGIQELVGVYQNTPKQSVRGRSPIHHGAIRLRLAGDPVSSLAGEYWTDRQSRGELRFTARDPRTAESYEAASVMFATSASGDGVPQG